MSDDGKSDDVTIEEAIAAWKADRDRWRDEAERVKGLARDALEYIERYPALTAFVMRGREVEELRKAVQEKPA